MAIRRNAATGNPRWRKCRKKKNQRCDAPDFCAAVLSSPIHLNLIQSQHPLPVRGVVLYSVFGRRNREAAFSINILVFSMLGWIEPVEPPMQGLPNPLDEV